MKSFPVRSLKFFAVIVACCFVASSASYGGADRADYRSRGTARLVVHRAADFGTLISLNIFIDGVQVTMLPQNTGYDALVIPGDHVLAVSTSPCPYGKTRYTRRNVRMRPGQTYAFTAVWEYADWATLDTGERVVDLVRDMGHY